MPKANIKKNPLGKLIRVLGWITGVLVALAVGFGMTNGVLTVPLVEPIVPLAGWIVIILTIVDVILVIIDKFK